MVTTISTDEVGERLSEVLRLTSDGQDVILEHDGKPQAVIISTKAYNDVQRLRDAERRWLAGEELFRLREEVSSRNTDLSEEQAEDLAGRIIRDAVDSLAERGALDFERDHPLG